MKPVLDHRVVDALAEELQSLPDALLFVGAFHALLCSRLTRISEALIGGDREEATTALLSLHTGAAMVGATELRETTSDALAMVHAGTISTGPARGLVRQLTDQAHRFSTAFESMRLPTTAT